ncbi:hypothetical protein [Bradyrhizobium lablabi]|uniref:hypothetical protein n=1 Tax=Bradyrhizobium lablabi TaxID=722472 RepID=UPI001BA981E0|nr:hypothetical protein [Bradyrhizobium lablabi]MBR0691917.1 hypothetical protein [Bradyrhizobium lablabi]
MTNLEEHGFRQAQTFALEQLTTVYSTSGDLRWALVVALAQAVSAAWSHGRARIAKRVREAVRRFAPVGPFDGECHCC